MTVAWTEQFTNFAALPEEYLKEDLSKLDRKYEGKVLGNVAIWGTSYFIVACNDGKCREVPINDVKIINQ